MAETILFVDLGLDDPSRNIELAHCLNDSGLEGFGFKTNQDDAMILGEPYIRDIQDIGRPHFVDLKMNNGASTMARTAQWLGGMGVDYTNVWAHAESNFVGMMDKLASDPDRPKVLGVTFYTRWDEQYAQSHHNMSLQELVRHWAYVAVDSGADGIILPGNVLSEVADLTVEKLNPGVRRTKDQKTASAQKQVSTPFENVVAGANLLVVGSPIYGDENPVESLAYFLSEMKRGQDYLEQQNDRI